MTDMKLVLASRTRDVSHATPYRAWIAHLIALCALIGLLGLANAGTIANAIDVWWNSPTFSHCFLIIPISAYLVWRRRSMLENIVPCAFPLALLLAVPLLGLSLAGRSAQINEIQQLAFIGLLQVLILAVLGPEVYRRVLFPSLFLFFLVPMGEYLIAPLQRFTTNFVSGGLTILNIPHYTDQYFIKLSNGVFEVAEACAGLRFLIATIAVSVLFVHLNYRKWHKIILFLAASVVVPVIANGFRALGIVLIAHWSDNKIAVGVDHIVYGWGFLVGILTALMLIGVRYADPVTEERHWPSVPIPMLRPRAFLVTIVISLAGISFVPGLYYWQSGRSSNLDSRSFSAPLTLSGWQSGAVSGGWFPNYVAPDARLAFAMHGTALSSLDVDVFVNYYGGQNGSRSLIDPKNKLWSEDLWRPVSQGNIQANIGGHAVDFGEAVIASGGLVRMIWWSYWAGGRFTTSTRDVKLQTLRHMFSREGGSGLIALSTPVSVDLAEARGRLSRALEALGGITVRLEQAEHE